MQFHVEPLQSRRLRLRCPNVVVADGVIEPDTPETLSSISPGRRRAAPNLKSVLLINSPGGNVVASMEFGVKLRELGMAAIVAGYGYDGMRAGPTAGECVSACVYALMGAVRRVAPDAEPRRAAPHVGRAERSADARPRRASSRAGFADERLVDIVARYARQMGVSPDVVRQAESLDADHIRMLSQGEMRRWRLATPKL